MDTLNIVQDSLMISADTLYSTIVPSINIQCVPEKSWSDIASWILPLVFSVITFYLGRLSNKKKEVKDDTIIEANRRMSLFKTLILDYNLKYVYDFFNNLDVQLVKLKQRGVDKRKLEPHIQNVFKLLNEKFIFMLTAVDNEYYYSILNLSDEFRGQLLSTIADDGVNLFVDKKYSELIDTPTKNFKAKLLKALFEYRGL